MAEPITPPLPDRLKLLEQGRARNQAKHYAMN